MIASPGKQVKFCVACMCHVLKKLVWWASEIFMWYCCFLLLLAILPNASLSATPTQSIVVRLHWQGHFTFSWLPIMPCPSKNTAFIDWRNSKVKETILLMDETWNVSKRGREIYQAANLPEFEGVCFKQFRDCLKDHCAIEKKKQQSMLEKLVLQHDLTLHPHDKTHDCCGKPIFDRSPAKGLLCQDIKEGAYPYLTPMELWNSHPKYKVFQLDVFWGRIYQEIWWTKFLNWCKLKHEQKESQKCNHKF